MKSEGKCGWSPQSLPCGEGGAGKPWPTPSLTGRKSFHWVLGRPQVVRNEPNRSTKQERTQPGKELMLKIQHQNNCLRIESELTGLLYSHVFGKIKNVIGLSIWGEYQSF